MSARSGWPCVDDLFVSQIGDGTVPSSVDPFFYGRAALLELLDHRREIVFEHQHFRAGVAQDGGQLQLRQADVQRHHDAARLHHAVVAFNQLVSVEAQVRDAVARGDAEFRKAGGQLLAAFAELRRK